jgi:hypothetical protein
MSYIGNHDSKPRDTSATHAAHNSDGGLTALVMQCAFAVLAGQQTVTISATGKRPPGFPRGELLSVGTDGSHNYACHPVKVLAWLHSRTTKQPNAEAMRHAERTDQ